MFAYCWANGEIEFGSRVPEGAIGFLRGPEEALVNAVQVAARHAYDGKSYLVPGVPEAGSNQKRACDALISWTRHNEHFWEDEGLSVGSFDEDDEEDVDHA